MKSNSDESDYESSKFENQGDNESTEETEAYRSYFNQNKRMKMMGQTNISDKASHSSSNGSEVDEDYYEERRKKKVKSHNMYQGFSSGQSSEQECSSQSTQYRSTDAATLNYKAEETRTTKRLYEDTSHFNKRPKLHKSRVKTDKDTADKEKEYNAREQSSIQETKNGFGAQDKAQRMMKRMGYTEGSDLGKNKQGRLEPVEAAKQLGHRGLGHHVPGLQASGHKWTAEEEEVKVIGEDKAQRMMKMMGYKEGSGLGKNKQGRLEPVEAAKQLGRRGLGHHVPGLQASGHKWTAEEEEIKVIEDQEWISNSHVNSLSLREMQQWLEKGSEKLAIDEETHFCHEDVVRDVVNAKTLFDRLDNVELRRARKRCNPYETIRGAFFLNRAAVKMANIDKACEFMFTNPKCREKDELLYFADVCAGPGGFSEYVLWKKKWHAKGFGMTLKNSNDFKLDDFYAGPCETFHPYYGPKEDGDVFDPSNQEKFRDLIMSHTRGKGVHFMMSDGGFSVEGQENIQEILSKQLYLCQCLIALMIVRVKGHFVTKLFDIFTPFSAGLVYLMYRCFEEVCLFKPNSSRPANSERYLICKRKRPCTEDTVQYLKLVNDMLLKGNKDDTVLQLVSFKELERERQFVQYLRKSNNNLGRKQIVGLQKIAAFCEDPTLIETKQADMRRGCLEYWEIPDKSRTAPRYVKPHERFNRLLSNSSNNFTKPPTKLTLENVESTVLTTPYDWFCMPCGTGPCNEENKNATLYLGAGRRNVYRYLRGSWVRVEELHIELPADTLVYAEVVYEMTNKSKMLQKVLALHILDAFFLGGENIGHKYIKERHRLTKQFCEALWKPTGNSYGRVRAKDLFPVGPNLREQLKVMERKMKNNLPALVYELSETPMDSVSSEIDKQCFIPNSVIFLKSIAHPWGRHYSKTHSMTYVFNSKTDDKKFDSERQSEAEASFSESFVNRCIWYWPRDEKLTMKSFAAIIEEKYASHENILLNY